MQPKGSQFKPLLHGSPHEIAPGDTIWATSDTWTEKPVAYATTDESLAKLHAGSISHGETTSMYPRTSKGSSQPEQGKLFNYVYEVEHGPDSKNMDNHKVTGRDGATRGYPFQDTYSSETGYKVKGVHDYAPTYFIDRDAEQQLTEMGRYKRI